MSALPSRRLGAATEWLVAVLLAFSSIPASADNSTTAGSPPEFQADAARHWAGDLTSVRRSLVRTPHGGMPALFSAADHLRLRNEPLAPGTIASQQDDGKWSLLAGSGGAGHAAGPARVAHSAIYDPIRNRMVIFGGFANDTWVLDMSGPEGTWQRLPTQGDPSTSLAYHSAVYDTNSDRMVVYGGYYYGYFLDEVWVLDFTATPPAWTRLEPTGPAPVARAAHAAIYDPVEDRMVVFAGYDGASAPDFRRKDVWALSLGESPAWTEITPSVDGPSARSSLEAVYDNSRHAMVIFGGTDPEFRNDVWALSLGGSPVWAPVAAAGTLPPAREEHSMVYDAENDRLVVYGGYDAYFLYGDTWSLTLAEPPTWNEIEPTGLGPGPRWGHTAVYDRDGSRAILFGGGTNYRPPTGTFVLSLSGPPAWSHPIVGPGPGPVRHTFASVYDSRRHRMVLFGGSNVSLHLNDTFAITLDDHPTWSQVPTAGTPPRRRRLVEGIYDPVADRMIVFGGWDEGTVLGDLWQLSFATDPPTWSPLATAGTAPTARAGHGVIYDPQGHRMIVFAGWDGVSPNYRRNDLWALDLEPATPEWTLLSTQGVPPSPRSSHSVVYDSERKRMVVFGGTTPTFLDEVWVLSLSDLTWTRLAPTGTPPTPREEQSAIYDPVRQRLVIFGGYDDLYFTASEDIWELSLDDAPEWRQMTPEGPQPIYRWGHAAVYDRERDRMVMHGGLGPGLDQTWALTWSQPQTSVPILMNVAVTSGGVQLTWNLFGGAFLGARVYRSQDGNSWVTAGTASVGPDGLATFDDQSVVPGIRYAFRAGVMAGNIEHYSEITWVDVPMATDLAGDEPFALRLDEVRPNPARRDMSLAFSIPRRAPGTIDLFDASGRKRWSRSLSELGPGNHVVRLAEEAKLSAGVYLVRFSHGNVTLSRKVCVIRD